MVMGYYICKERTLIFRFIVIGSTTTVGLLDIFFISWLRLSFLGYSIRAIHFNEGTCDSTKGSAASTRLKQQQPTPIFTVLLKLYILFFFFSLYNCVAVCALYKKMKERKENWVYHQITTTRRCVYTTTRRQSKRLENGNKFQNSTIAADRFTLFYFFSIFTVKQRNEEEEAENTDLQWVSFSPLLYIIKIHILRVFVYNIREKSLTLQANPLARKASFT